MADSSSLRSRVTEIATCPICREDFKDPRSLPCVHSFCLQCLQGHCKDKCTGDDVPCPLCRKEFQIPRDGVEALPHNFFLQNLVDAKTTKHQPGTSSCEPCYKEGRTTSATMYCVDCSQKLCNNCSVPHKNWRGGAHDVRAMGEELSEELIWLRGSYCDKHPDKRMEWYCFDCRGNICMKCRVSHRNHQYEEIKKVAKNCVASIESDVKPFPCRISQFHEAVQRVELANEKFLMNVERIAFKVQTKGDEMKRLVDNHVAKLMQELNEAKISSAKETKIRVEGFELALTALESFHAYASQLTSKGSACDITRAANDLHVRAGELLKTYVTSSGDYVFPNIVFVATSVEKITGGQNVLGSVLTSSEPQVIHTFPKAAKAKPVCGVTLLNNELYVLHRNTDQVDVYSTADFALLRHLNVTALSNRRDTARTGMFDITSCVRKQCVYISDYSCIHRVGLDNSVSKRDVRESPRGLSMTRSCNLLVTCADRQGQNGQLVELSSEDGRCVQEITLQSDIKYARHSIQLANSHYVVCHGWGAGAVSLVGSDGRVIRRHSGDVRLGGARLHMAVDGDGFIFVADSGNDQIVLLDPSLKYARHVLQHTEHRPRCLCFDDVTRRLYVGQDDGTISVVQL